jgi:hypothetical protein
MPKNPTVRRPSAFEAMTFDHPHSQRGPRIGGIP